MIFFQLTQARIAERMLSLPMGLQFVLDDAETKLLVDNIAQESGIKSDGVSILETLVSLVFMGFLNTEKVYDELVELGVEKPLADTITKRLQTEIFADFDSLLKQVYAPVEAAPTPAPAAAAPAAMPMPAPLPQTAAPKVPPAPFGGAAPISAPGGARPPAAAPIKPLPQANGMPQPAPAPVPFMLRKETTAVPAAPTFKLSVDPSIFGGKPGGKPSMPIPPRPAQLELGKEAAQTGPKPSPGVNVPPPPTMRPIHYAGPLSSIGISAAPKRPMAPIAAPGTPKPPEVHPASPAPAASPATPPGVPVARPKPAAPAALPVAPTPISGTPIRDLSLSAREDSRRFAAGKDLAPHLAPKNITAPTAPAPFSGVPAPAPASMPAPAAPPATEPKKPPRVVNFTEGGEAG